MKRSLAAIIAIAAVSTSAHADTAKLKELMDQRREVNAAIRKVMPDPNKADPELDRLQKESVKAAVAYQKAIDDHPNLQALKAEHNAATTKLTAAIATKDQAARDAAQKDISATMKRRMEAAAKEPDLEPIAKANQAAADAYVARLNEFLGSHPDTKDNFAKLEKLRTEIQEELKNQKAN